MRILAVLVVLAGFGLATIGCEEPKPPEKKATPSVTPEKKTTEPAKSEEPAPAAPTAKTEEKPLESPPAPPVKPTEPEKKAEPANPARPRRRRFRKRRRSRKRSRRRRPISRSAHITREAANWSADFAEALRNLRMFFCAGRMDGHGRPEADRRIERARAEISARSFVCAAANSPAVRAVGACLVN